MKQSIPTGVAVAAIVVVVAVALFFGIRALNVSHHTSQYSGANYATKMAEIRQKQNQDAMQSGSGTGAYYQRMHQMMQNSAGSGGSSGGR